MLQKLTGKWLWIPLFLCAFLFPTCLDLPWDGIPVNHRGEFLVLLIGSVFILREFLVSITASKTRPTPIGSHFRSRVTLLIFCLSGFLLIVKMTAPPKEGIEASYRDPQLDSKARYTSEKFIHRIEYGGGHTPWRLGFLNTTRYNFISCNGNTDKNCLLQRKQKETLSLPFEASFRIPRPWLSDPATLAIEYRGFVEIKTDHQNPAITYFSQETSRITLPLPKSQGAVTVSYKNFSPGKPETLPFSLASLLVETHVPKRYLWPERAARVTLFLLSTLLVLLIGCELAPSLFAFWKLVQSSNGMFASSGWFLCLVGFFLVTFQRSFWILHSGFLLPLSLGLFLALWYALAKPKNLSAQGELSIDLVFTLPAFLLLGPVLIGLPHHDGFSLMSDGNDWLSYASSGYEWIEKPAWFTDAYYVFTKPLYVYFRGSLYALLGEGTTYFETLCRFLLALTPLLFLPAISKLLIRIPRSRWYFFVPIITYAFFWCLKNFAAYVLIFWVNMGEIPEWFFGILATAALFYAATDLSEEIKNERAIQFAFLFTLLSAVSRLQSLAVLVLPWAAAISFSKTESRRLLRTGLLCCLVTLLIILIHALPVLLRNRETLVAYLGWTTQVKAKEPLSSLLSSFWKRVTFAPQVKVLLLFLPLVALGTLGYRRKFNAISAWFFLLAFFVCLALHAGIRDAAYAPRHFVLLSQVAAYLTILFSGLFLSKTPSQQSNR